MSDANDFGLNDIIIKKNTIFFIVSLEGETRLGRDILAEVVIKESSYAQKRYHGWIHCHQLRTGGQGRKCAFPHFLTRSLRVKPLIELRVRN